MVSKPPSEPKGSEEQDFGEAKATFGPALGSDSGYNLGMRPFLDSTELLADGRDLYQRVQRDGYLFVRGLLPKEDLESLRTEWLGKLEKAGWIRKDTSLVEGIADPDAFCVEPQDAYMDVLHEVCRLRSSHALQQHPNLLRLLERMLGGPVIPHPRLIGRVIFPRRDEYTTPPHQDFINIQGTQETYTAWIPLSSLPVEIGGLQIAAGSHRGGVYDFRPALGAGGLAVTEPLEKAWVYSPVQQGDVIIFHSMAVHKGLPNRGNRLRLSIDGRYQRVTDPITADSLKPHDRRHSWEAIYAGWPAADPLKYYWRQWDLRIESFDSSYFERRDEMGLELASQGDPNSRSILERIIARDPDPAKRVKAAELLSELTLTEP